MELIDINDSASTSLAILLVARILLISGLTAYLWEWLPSKKAQAVSAIKQYHNGPKPWPIVGNLISFLKLSKNPDQELVRLVNKYGGICMLWLSSTPIMIISKAEDAKRLLDKVNLTPTQTDNRISCLTVNRKGPYTQTGRRRTRSAERPGHGDWQQRESALNFASSDASTTISWGSNKPLVSASTRTTKPGSC